MFPLQIAAREASHYAPRSWKWAGKQVAGNSRLFIFVMCILHLMSEAEAGAGNNIEQTPSWKIGIFFSIFLVLSVIFETALEELEEYLHHKHLDGIKMTVEKIKEELMLMGFISLCLLIVEDYLVEWCLPADGHVGVASELKTLDGDWVCPKYHDAASEVGRANLGLSPSGPQYDYCTCFSNSSSSAGSGASSAGSGASSAGRMLAAASSAAGSTAACALKAGMKSSAISNGATNYADSTRRMLLGGAFYECKGCGEVYFIDLKALHQAHTMIFIIACTHIIYSCIIMAVSSSRMEKWLQWEDLGRDSDGSVLSKEATIKQLKQLKMPPDHNNKCRAFLCACGEQFYIGVDAFTFIALRKFYIAKHSLEPDFEFHTFLKKGIQHDFAEMLGIRWWMYLLLVAQVILEGFGVGNLGIFNWIATFIVFTAGAKLQSVCGGLALAIHNHYDADGDHQIDFQELQALQKQDDGDHFDEIEAEFWFNKPELLLTMIQYAMWQNSQTLSIMFYYAIFIGKGTGESCYERNRSLPMIGVQFFFACLGLVLNSTITVPTYSLVTHMGTHAGKTNLLQMHRITQQLKKEGGSMDGAMKGMNSTQKASLARMQADGTFSAGKQETMADAIGRMAMKAEALAKAQEKTMKLIDMAAEMTNVNEIERLFKVVCEDARNLCGSDRATLFLVDDDTDEVWSIVAEGIPPIRFNKTIGIIGACVSAPSILNIPDAYADPRFNKAIDLKSNYKTNNILCVPILHNRTKKCIGAMQIINKTHIEMNSVTKDEAEVSADFDTDDIKIMGSFCKVVANSIVTLQTERRKSIVGGAVDPYSPRKQEAETKKNGDKEPPVKVKRNQVAPDPTE